MDAVDELIAATEYLLNLRENNRNPRMLSEGEINKEVREALDRVKAQRPTGDGVAASA